MEVWGGCALPDDVFYDLEADVWVRLEGSAATIGMTDVAQTRMGRLVQLSWKEPGKRVARGRPLSVLESAKWVGPVVSPLSGTIIANNRLVFEEDIAAANRDPYGTGWIYRIEVENRAEIDLLVVGATAVNHYRNIIDSENIRCYRCVD